MRTITHSEFQAASGEPVYVSHIHTSSRAEQKAVDAAAQAVVVPAAFVPDDGLAGIVGKGREFDPQEGGQATYKGPPQVFTNEEPWPSDKTATEYAPEAVSGEYAAQAVAAKQALDALAAQAQELGLYNMPPNCDFVSHGEALAHAQHRAAEGGEGCDSVACSITQGVSD